MACFADIYKQMTDSSEWDMEIWRPEVEHVTRGRSPIECDMFNVSYVLSSNQLKNLELYVSWNHFRICICMI